MGKCGTRQFGAAVGLILLAGAAAADCVPGSLEVRAPSGSVMRFSVEVADSEAERNLGLMNRAEMPTSSGMLFVFPEPKHAFFWMKNTLIPLDMIFADSTGTVTRVHPMAVPLDETGIDGGVGVQYVLEINGGLAERLGLDEGAVMRSPDMDQSQAVWACAGE